MTRHPQTFRDERWLRQHAVQLLNFYYPDCVDHRFGGYIAQLSDVDGHVYDGKSKHLVAHCRLVFNFAVGDLLDGPDWCRSAASHGVTYLLDEWRAADGGYAWVRSGREVADPQRTCYGHAFVLLAYATAAKADIPRAENAVHETADLIIERFWEDEHGLCRGKLDEDWTPIEEYRGQNANMHTCEAFIAAYEATGDEEYLDRAATIAENLARDLADEGDGLLWEHYTTDWELDWEYNRDEPAHLFRPWGYQPGHLLEWSKLLCTLHEHRGDDWLVERAAHFFDAAVEHGWDDEHGGLVYNFDRDGEVILPDKYYWPPCEGMGAAARLATLTGDDDYWAWYDRFWDYSWEHLVNPRYGNWYFKLTPDNQVHEDIDGTPKVTPGYHPIGACFDVLRTTAE
jgi:mannose/cellobiose epimerase-like protein (N-acyl-D-glucosamine 2-epimerase family)